MDVVVWTGENLLKRFLAEPSGHGGLTTSKALDGRGAEAVRILAKLYGGDEARAFYQVRRADTVGGRRP